MKNSLESSTFPKLRRNNVFIHGGELEVESLQEELDTG
jgi:hypothetical protein